MIRSWDHLLCIMVFHGTSDFVTSQRSFLLGNDTEKTPRSMEMIGDWQLLLNFSFTYEKNNLLLPLNKNRSFRWTMEMVYMSFPTFPVRRHDFLLICKLRSRAIIIVTRKGLIFKWRTISSFYSWNVGHVRYRLYI